MLLAVRISSYGCTWKIWRALKKLDLLSAAPRATLTHLSCSPSLPRASITRYTHAKQLSISSRAKTLSKWWLRSSACARTTRGTSAFNFRWFQQPIRSCGIVLTANQRCGQNLAAVSKNLWDFVSGPILAVAVRENLWEPLKLGLISG